MSELPDAKILAVRLASVFADAVVEMLRSGQAQGIDYDPDVFDFVVSPLEPGTSPTDVGLWVGERWQDYVGDIGLTTEPAHPEYSETALRLAIVNRLDRSGLLRRIALSIAADRVHQELEALRDRVPLH